MHTEIIISGFGGQGVLFAGQLLAYTALDNNLNVTWFPSYGPEMRGGTAHCTVIISEYDIGSPVVKYPSAAIVMNIPSLEKYEPLMKPGGTLIVNQSLVDRETKRDDIHVYMVPANEIAEELGDRRLTNMILLGTLLAVGDGLTTEQVAASLDIHIPEHRRNLLEANYEAIERGAQIGLETIVDA